MYDQRSKLQSYNWSWVAFRPPKRTRLGPGRLSPRVIHFWYHLIIGAKSSNGRLRKAPLSVWHSPPEFLGVVCSVFVSGAWSSRSRKCERTGTVISCRTASSINPPGGFSSAGAVAVAKPKVVGGGYLAEVPKVKRSGQSREPGEAPRVYGASIKLRKTPGRYDRLRINERNYRGEDLYLVLSQSRRQVRLPTMETIDDRFEYPGTTAWTHKVQIFSRHSEFATPREFDRTQVWTNRRHRKLVTIPPLSPPYGFGIVWRSSQTQNELKICIGIGFCKLAGGGGRFSTNPSAALDSNFVEDFVGNGKNRTAQFGYLKVAHVTITSTGVASSDVEGVAASRRSGTPNPHDLCELCIGTRPKPSPLALSSPGGGHLLEQLKRPIALFQCSGLASSVNKLARIVVVSWWCEKERGSRSEEKDAEKTEARRRGESVANKTRIPIELLLLADAPGEGAPFGRAGRSRFVPEAVGKKPPTSGTNQADGTHNLRSALREVSIAVPSIDRDDAQLRILRAFLSAPLENNLSPSFGPPGCNPRRQLPDGTCTVLGVESRVAGWGAFDWPVLGDSAGNGNGAGAQASRAAAQQLILEGPVVGSTKSDRTTKKNCGATSESYSTRCAELLKNVSQKSEDKTLQKDAGNKVFPIIRVRLSIGASRPPPRSHTSLTVAFPWLLSARRRPYKDSPFNSSASSWSVIIIDNGEGVLYRLPEKSEVSGSGCVIAGSKSVPTRGPQEAFGILSRTCFINLLSWVWSAYCIVTAVIAGSGHGSKKSECACLALPTSVLGICETIRRRRHCTTYRVPTPSDIR
ncbi:hypothetical protein GEV33_011264 [Tenebrio molitor]|uniref:Uncharacterized protein n=1 Tax=Tenebrio molitor TaxID=7067 RepID=A0A8J6HCG9_TENMO|nr:hypothetical protein GEV33_011264 [Tenebrio molitor]